MEIKLVGVDAAVRSAGIAKARLILPERKIIIDDLILGQTEKEDGKQVRKNSDDLRRSQEIVRKLRDAVTDAAFVISEIPSGAQSQRASFLLGATLGILAGLEYIKKPLIQVMPIETKLYSVGTKTASKAEMINWAYSLYPNLPWKRGKVSKRANKLIDANEHLADAIAVIHAGIETAEFKQAIALMSGMIQTAA